MVVKVKELVQELSLLPVRHNTLRAQRRELGLSRVALARILVVDPSSVYRQELKHLMSMLWNYALRAIKAEADDKILKSHRRLHKNSLATMDKTTGPARLEAEGYKLTAHKMREDMGKQAKQKGEAASLPKATAQGSVNRRPRRPSEEKIKAIAKAAADRAEARAAANKRE
jgi:hypothetical protein